MEINKEIALTALKNTINHKSLTLNKESFILLEHVMMFLQNELPEKQEVIIPEDMETDHE